MHIVLTNCFDILIEVGYRPFGRELTKNLVKLLGKMLDRVVMEADMESLGFGIIPVWCKVWDEEKEETLPPGQAQNRCDKTNC